MSLLITLALAAAATLSGSYDCTFERQAVMTEAGVQPGAMVNFEGADRDNWRFSLRLREHGNAATEVEVTWPANPIQIAGTQAAIDVAPDHLAFIAMARGPCMFTETHCLALVQLSARADGSAFFTIMPSGLSRDQAGVSSQLHVILTGTCRRRGGS